MNTTQKIPAEHRYRRVLLAVNKARRNRLLLLTLFNFIYAFVMIWFAAFKPNNAFQRYSIDDFFRSCVSNIGNFYLEILIVIIASFLIGFVLHRLSWVVKAENKSVIEEYLALYSDFLASVSLLPLIMDPVLLSQYEPRGNSLAKKISTYVNYEKAKRTYSISFVNSVVSIPYQVGLILQLINLHNIKEPKVNISRTRISIFNGAVLICLLLVVPAIALFSLSLQLEANIVVTIIAVDLIAAITLFIFFFGNRIDNNQAKTSAISNIIMVLFFRDPEHDFVMFDYRRYHPDLTYEYSVGIIESYLYANHNDSSEMID